MHFITVYGRLLYVVMKPQFQARQGTYRIYKFRRASLDFASCKTLPFITFAHENYLLPYRILLSIDTTLAFHRLDTTILLFENIFHKYFWLSHSLNLFM